ncbi:hypothetical protein K8T06_15675 [bacterium]|nr:hypothetical protein [bacterium]
MKWRRWLSLTILIGLILVAVALQTEKPTIQLLELRKERSATHFRSVRFAPETITAWAVGFNGVILKTTNAGKTWENQNSGCNARLYGLQVMDKNLVWTCGSGGTLLGTVDGGKTWDKIKVPTQLRLLDVCFVNRNIGWIAGDNGAIFKTKNGGKTWRRQKTDVDSGFRRIWFADKNKGYVVGYEGVALTTDNGGDTWLQLKTPEHISFYGAAFKENGRVFQLVGSCGTILQSTDFGASTDLLPIITTNFLRDIEFDSEGYGIIVGYSLTLVFDPVIGKWKKGQIIPNINLQGIAMGPEGACIAVGKWGSILTSRDHGKTWDLAADRFSPDLMAIVSDEKHGAVAAGADGWTMLKSPGSDHWIPEYTGISLTLKSVAIDQLGRLWVVGRKRSAFRKESNQPWKLISSLGAGDFNDIMFMGSSGGYIVGDSGLIMSTNNSGDTWKIIPRINATDIHSIAFINAQNGFIVGENGMIMETTNGGDTWLNHYTGSLDTFLSAWFDSNGHSIVVGTQSTLESMSNGHNSSWFHCGNTIPFTAIAAGARYAALLNGDILDRNTGVSRCLSSDPVYSLCRNKKGDKILGAGKFGRIIELSVNDISLKLKSKTNK